MNLFLQFVLSYLATISFGIFFGAPFHTILATGLVGGLSWVFNLITSSYFNSKVSGAFFGALLIGILGEIFARKFKKPATVFITAGLVPLVPGAGMYYTMFYLVEKNFDECIRYGTETFFIAGSIAVGILLSTVIFRVIREEWKYN